MLLLRAEKIKKSYGERTLLEAEELSVYTNDKIGVVGANGAGKTTLFAILAGELEPDEGNIFRFGEISYCRQFEEEAADRHEAAEERKGKPERTEKMEAELEMIEGEAVREEKRWRVPEREDEAKISGGERMRKKLARAFGKNRHVLLLDEPTANLDREGIAQLTEQLGRVETFLCISHDRKLLNEACTRILEVSGGKIRLYQGNYREYERQKVEERQQAMREYEEYAAEKSRLEAVYRQKRESAERMTKIPANMTPREARLRDFLCTSGRNSSGKQKSMNRAADNIKKRIDHMEGKEKPRQEVFMRLNFAKTDPPESRKILEMKDVSFSYGENRIFEGISFSLSNHKKTALLGKNGSGKTTLLHMIEKAGQEPQPGIRIVPKAKIGVLHQDLSRLEPEKTVLENAMARSVQEPAAVKNVLAGLLFGVNDWEKKVSVLSGGEKMKLAFARLLVSDANVLLLDEPTNYLDLLSVEALEKQLKAYEGAVLFVSHDSAFTEQVAQELLLIENRKVVKFSGSCEAYREEQKRRQHAADSRRERIKKEERMRLELKLAQLSGVLGHAPSLEEKERLEAEYWEIVKRLREE